MINDGIEARGLSFNRDHIDIYVAAWGPEDDGRTVDGPGPLARKAFEDGVTRGRGGKGSIYVWASGTGGSFHDNCNCDGYTNSIYTISISGATDNGSVPWFAEPCSSTLAATYSSGARYNEAKIYTTELFGGCTTEHGGTSTAAPLAAGMCALALEANPSLTWRDLQHIIVRSSRSEHLHVNDTQVNGMGKNVSQWFGFGLTDAGAMVKLAKNWTKVTEQRTCKTTLHIEEM